MARILLLSLLILTRAFSACGQIHTAVSADRMNIVYVGLPNPLRVAAEGIPCKSLWLTSDNGKVEKLDQCLFDFRPDTARTSTVYICRLRGKDTLVIDSAKFRTKWIPDPIPTIAGKHGGSVPLNVFRVQLGMACYYNDVCAHARVKYFTMTILKNSGEWKELSATEGPYFTPAMKAEINTLEKGERIFFSGIEADGAGKKGLRLEPFLITIE